MLRLHSSLPRVLMLADLKTLEASTWLWLEETLGAADIDAYA